MHHLTERRIPLAAHAQRRADFAVGVGAGNAAVLFASHLAAPKLPAGFEVRWNVDVANGGVDERAEDYWQAIDRLDAARLQSTIY